ncbi:MAG: hypothetical protein DRQ10_03790, partial [Candidatus Hydrothermota bacterium]
MDIKFEFWAEFDLFSENNKKRIINGFISDDSLPIPWSHITDLSTRQHILAQLLSIDDKCAGKTKCKDYVKGKNGFQKWYYAGDLQNPRGDFQMFLCKRLRWMGDILNLANSHETVSPSLPDLSIFPKGSWAIQVNFTLKKPYISKDDVDFYIIDNPVKKEWVFKVPYVAPSQWKGALRSTMIRELVSKLENGKIDEDEFVTERLQLYRLFGNEKDGTASFLNRVLALHRVGPVPEDGTENEEWQEKFREEILKIEKEFDREPREKEYLVGNIEGYQGSLHFYPTFFDRIGLEVINPHDRNTGAGKKPIYFECVPAGTPGVFTLLYVPPVNTDENTARADLKAVAKGVQAML